jgi:hypothetical protein
MTMVAVPSLPSCEWEGFANALVAAANAATTAVVTVAIAAADKSTTATLQPLHDNKTAALLYPHQGWTDKKDRNENELCGYSGNTLRISFCSCLQVINLLDTASKSSFAKSGLGKK